MRDSADSSDASMLNPSSYSDSKSFLRPRPGVWELPMYLHRKPILDSVLRAAPVLRGRLLDVGCGTRPYLPLLDVSEYVGVDVERSPHHLDKAVVLYDGLHLPFPDDAFASVLCTEVLEHCGEPDVLLQEISRVLKQGGHCLLTAPMVIEHHEVPHDGFRFTRFALERLAARSRLDVVWILPRGHQYDVWVYATYSAISYTLSRRPWKDLVMWFVWPWTIVAHLLDGWRSNDVTLTLGWQVLMKKHDTGA